MQDSIKYKILMRKYSFVSNKRRVANKRRVWKRYQNLEPKQFKNNLIMLEDNPQFEFAA